MRAFWKSHVVPPGHYVTAAIVKIHGRAAPITTAEIFSMLVDTLSDPLVFFRLGLL